MFSNQVNGHAVPGSEHLTSNIDYFTVVTPVDIINATLMVGNAVSNTGADANYGAPAGEPDGYPYQNTMTALDKLIEIIAQRGQPVIMGTPTQVSGGLYSFRFATEHYSSWAVEPSPLAGGTYGAGPQDQGSLANAAASAMQNAIVAAGVDWGFNSNTTVTVSNSL